MTNFIKCRTAPGIFFVALMLTSGALSSARALSINLTYDSSVTSLSNASQFESAVNWAAQRIQGLITTPITVNITVKAVNGASFLGEAGPNYYDTYYSYSQIRSHLTTLASQAYLPTNDPTPTGGLYVIPNAQAKAWGTIGPSTASDGTFTINTAQSYSFDPDNRAVPGKYDFVGVAEHEITHVLGRSNGLGDLNGYLLFFPYDLYRYNSSGGKTMIWGYNDYFSMNGGVTNLQTYDSTSDSSDWWMNAVGDAFIAYTPPDTQNGFSQADFDVMYVLGYSENLATALPVMTSGTTANAVAGQPFSYTITASNGPISFGVYSGLPYWLSVNQATGVISGTPPSSGTYSMQIVAANAQGGADETLTINVSATGGASDPFNGSSLGGGYYYSTWFGTYNSQFYPWDYRTDIGFFYIDPVGASDLYLYVLNGNSSPMGWIYTTATLFPNVYSFTRNSWLYFEGNTSFYNYTTKSFENY